MDLLGGRAATGVFPTFDYSALSNYYSSGASLGIAANRQMLQAAIDQIDPNAANATPPWKQPAASEEEARRFLKDAPFINPNDPRIAASGVPSDSDYGKLFSLYVGLSTMKDMVAFARDDANGQRLTPLLDRRFQSALSEIRGYVDALSFDSQTLLYGVQQASYSSTATFAAKPEFLGQDYIGAVTSEKRDAAIPGLTGTESFKITVDHDILGTVEVAADLSNVTGALTEDNIVSYLNDEMEAAGVASRFATERFAEFSYGLRVEVASSEQVSFSEASNPTTAVYLAGHTQAGDFSRAFMTEFDNLEDATPGGIFRDVIDGEGVDRANATAVDSQGNVYMVGTVQDSLDGQTPQGDGDVYLRKYDSAGQLVWSRMLGANSETSGLAVTVDGNDNVIIAGQTTDTLSPTAIEGGIDSFVTKFDTAGVEQWTYQNPRYADDGALALSTDAAGNVFLAGYTRGSIGTDTSHGGGMDGFVTKLSADGTVDYNKQFGGTGDDKAIDIQVDSAGNFYVLGERDGQAVLRKYADDPVSQNAVWEVDLGNLSSGGDVTSLALGSNGSIYVAGQSAGTGLNGGVATAHSGGLDGFIQKIDDAGASASIDYVSYLGTADNDRINDIAVDTSGASDRIFVAGDTGGDLSGTGAPSIQAAFLAELDDAGALVDSRQVGSGFAHAGTSIAIDSDGKSVLSTLGLPSGTILNEPTDLVTAQTPVRAGQYFEISVNGGDSERITIEDDDTLGFLAFKINRVLGTSGRATVEGTGEERYLKLTADDGQVIHFQSGAGDQDALAPLGLKDVTLAGDPLPASDGIESSVFSLGIVDNLSLLDPESLADAGVIVDNAMREIREMYQFMATGGQSVDPLPPISEADAKRIAELEGALLRVQLIADNAQVGARTLYDMNV